MTKQGWRLFERGVLLGNKNCCGQQFAFDRLERYQNGCLQFVEHNQPSMQCRWTLAHWVIKVERTAQESTREQCGRTYSKKVFITCLNNDLANNLCW